jgi:hypothetical protein
VYEKMDLINWTIQEAGNLTSEPREPSNVDVIPPFDESLAIIQGKSLRPTDPGEPSALIIGNSSGIQTTGVQLAVEAPLGDEAVKVPEPNASELPAAAQTAISTSAEAQNETQQPALLTAIIKGDIHTAPVDRDRAIALRWALRDVRAKRLK